MKHNGSIQRLKLSADGAGVASHAGVGILRELAEGTGLVSSLDDALMDTSRGGSLRLPGTSIISVKSHFTLPASVSMAKRSFA